MTSVEQDRLSFLEGAKEDSWYTDATVPRDKVVWFTDDSDLESYDLDLSFPDNPEGLSGILLDTIGRNRDNVGIDIAGGTNGVALQDLLKDGILGTAILTNYVDSRSEETREIEELHHVDGDLVDRSTWEKILEKQKELAPEGLDLVMHRPVGGVQTLATDVYKGATNLLIDITKPGGVLFLQIPEALIHDDRSGTGQLNVGLDEVCASIADRNDIDRIIRSYVRFGVSPKLIDYVVLIKKQESVEFATG